MQNQQAPAEWNQGKQNQAHRVPNPDHSTVYRPKYQQAILSQVVASLFDPNKGPIALSTSLIQIIGAYDHVQVTTRLLPSFSTFIPKQQCLLWQHLLKLSLSINCMEPPWQHPNIPHGGRARSRAIVYDFTSALAQYSVISKAVQPSITQ